MEESSLCQKWARCHAPGDDKIHIREASEFNMNRNTIGEGGMSEVWRATDKQA